MPYISTIHFTLPEINAFRPNKYVELIVNFLSLLSLLLFCLLHCSMNLWAPGIQGWWVCCNFYGVHGPWEFEMTTLQSKKIELKHAFMIRAFTAQGLAVLCDPRDSSTQCVAECANAGSAGKRTRRGVHRPNGPQFNMAV